MTIGSSHSLANCWLPQFIYQYRQKYPHIKTQLKLFGDSKLLYQAVSRGIIDLSFSETQFIDCPEIWQQEIALIQYSLLVASSHPLAKKIGLLLPRLNKNPWYY